MDDLREYENKDGYRIRATSKAYELYYRKQGFRLVSPAAEPRPDASENCFAEMKTADLKKYLTEQGIPFGAKAKREELVALAEAAGNRAVSEKPEESKEDLEDDPDLVEE